MSNISSVSQGKKSNLLSKIRKFGGHMSGMVMPNLGAFVGWGIMAALFIPNGWFPNENLAEMVGPILNYLFPLLIGYTAGYNIHGQRGGVIGAFTTMGVIIGSDITMISGAMVMGPLSSWLLKKFDKKVEGRIKPGFEMFVNNFSLGILGAILTIFAFLTIGPVINLLIAGLTMGVQWTTEHQLIPLLSVFMAPAQVLFLNNVVNHGILAPIGYVQAAEMGKSIMFLVDTNNGPLLGTLFAIALFGKGRAKNTAPMAMFIAGIAGIGEVYFPFVLANPILLLATMGGLTVSLYLQVLLDGGLIGVASPGSLIAIAMMTPKSAIFANFISILAGFLVSTGIGIFLLKVFQGKGQDEDMKSEYSVGDKTIKTASHFVSHSPSGSSQAMNPIQKIIVACDSGMGSSAMGASVLRNRLKKEGYDYIEVVNTSANKITDDTDLVITLESLIERAKLSGKNSNTIYTFINNFLKEEDYDETLHLIKERNKTEETSEENKPVSFESILRPQNIVLDASFETKEEAIRAAGQILIDEGYVTNEYINSMIARNENLSTYIGNHLAIPHGLEDSQKYIRKSGISIIQIPEGVDFGDGNIAYVVIGIAGKDGTHLDILSKIALVCANEENVLEIKGIKEKSEILDIFTDFKE